MQTMPNLVGPRILFPFTLVLLTALFAAIPTGSAGAKDQLSAGQILPDLELPLPAQADQAAYLGLKPGPGQTFRLGQIERKWLLIEIFNMYCTICQGEAKSVNQLYEKIRQGPLNGQLAMIGIGMGNSPFEVNVFRKRYGVEFPLFPDSGYKAHKALGEPRTPHFLLVSLENGERRIFLSKVGPFGQPAGFLADLNKIIQGR